MQRLEVSGAVRPIYGSLGVKRLISRWLGRVKILVRQTLLPVKAKSVCIMSKFVPRRKHSTSVIQNQSVIVVYGKSRFFFPYKIHNSNLSNV